MPRHRASDGTQVRRADRCLVHDAALEHDGDAIGELEELVEIGAHQQHRSARIARCDDAVVDLRDGREIELTANLPLSVIPDVEYEQNTIKLRHGDRLLPPGRRFKHPQRIYQYDNGPRHTVGFEPDTFVDVTDDWRQASEWLGRQMAIVRNQPYEPTSPDASVRAKETLAAYRGATCGVRYAEAFRAANAYPQEIF